MCRDAFCCKSDAAAGATPGALLAAKLQSILDFAYLLNDRTIVAHHRRTIRDTRGCTWLRV